MKHPNAVSDEQLNALLDGELDSADTEQLLAAMATDPDIQTRFETLRRTKDLLTQAYAEVPQPILAPDTAHLRPKRGLPAVAASVLLLTGIFLGWLLGADRGQDNQPNIKSIAQIDAIATQQDKILLHISTAEETLVRDILTKASALLLSAKEKDTPLKLEIVANAEGLQVLRKNSPYQAQIHALSKRYENVKFLACGIAKKTAALKEGKPIELLPEAEDIPAALDRILHRLKEGWVYVGRK